METHGSESYFVLGEGLLGESVEGRAHTLAAAVEAAAPPFRFSRMGPNGVGLQLAEGNLKKLAAAMTVPVGGGGSQVPSGFTYLGQFIDHDLSFDKTQVMLGENVSPAQLLQARSPSLDLDSLYGAGPQDPESAKFYSDGVHLKIGDTVAVGGDPAKQPASPPPPPAGNASAARGHRRNHLSAGSKAARGTGATGTRARSAAPRSGNRCRVRAVRHCRTAA